MERKTVLITGAARGIGAQTAKLFAQNGYTVAVHCNTSTQQAQAVVENILSQNGRAAVFQADVQDAQQVNAMVRCIEEKFGAVDVLVNNAGIAQQKLFTDITDQDWQTMIATNLTGVFYCCRAVLPSMLRRHTGSIVNVSSMWGRTGASCEVHYSAAKGGVIALTKALAKEVAPSGVRVYCVAPGVIQTDMLAGLDQPALADLKNETPLLRLGSAEDVANAVYFLSNSTAAFITGQTLGVDGGFVI